MFWRTRFAYKTFWKSLLFYSVPLLWHFKTKWTITKKEQGSGNHKDSWGWMSDKLDHRVWPDGKNREDRVITSGREQFHMVFIKKIRRRKWRAWSTEHRTLANKMNSLYLLFLQMLWVQTSQSTAFFYLMSD